MQKYFCRLAVPFYFISSGYFLFRKTDLHDFDSEIAKNYCFKHLRLLGTWHIILIMGGTSHLWFLEATVVAVLILGLCLRAHMKLRHMYALAFFLYLIGALGSTYYGFIEPLKYVPVVNLIVNDSGHFFMSTAHVLFMGFIFVLMGATLACFEVKLTLAASISGFVGSMILLFIEVYLLIHYSIARNYNMYFFVLPAAFFLFCSARSIEIRDHVIFKHLRTAGILIYFTHIFVNEIVEFGINIVNGYLGVNCMPYHYILSLLCAILFASMLTWLSTKPRFKWLHWLFK